MTSGLHELGLGAVEYFDRVREKGYQPALVPGIMACVAAPFAVYHYGLGALPLVIVLAFAACAVSFIASPGLDSNFQSSDTATFGSARRYTSRKMPLSHHMSWSSM